MKYEDLPAAARAKVDAKIGRKPRQRNTSVITGPCEYRCHACPDEAPTFPSFEAAERHSRATGHVRQEMVIK